MLGAQHRWQLGLSQRFPSAHPSNNSSSRTWRVPLQWQGSNQGTEVAIMLSLKLSVSPGLGS
jgi:hypothetical protein